MLNEAPEITMDNSLKTLGGIHTDNVGARSVKGVALKAESGVNAESSGLASRLRAQDAPGSDGKVVDAARVSEIKQPIAEGRFEVNPDVVEVRLLQVVKELIGSYRQ